METAVFLVSAAIVLGGAVGVIVARNPVHAALSLVGTLFGVAVLFVAQEAHLLAAVQVIVYAGAIVVLFLFVIMLLGVDRVENLRTEPLAGQRPVALLVGLLSLAGVVLVLVGGSSATTGGESLTAAITDETPNVNQIATVLFTDYVLAFQLTGALLTIAVVGAVVLARRPPAAGGRPGGPADVGDDRAGDD
jgi:NADH-quinone oxidoreductase subunit J